MAEEKPIQDLDNFEQKDDFQDMGMDYGMDGFGDMGGMESPISKHSDLLKELTNFDPAIQRRIRNWLGLEWDDAVKDYKQKHEAIINEKGARWAVGFLQTYQSKTNIITNISQKEFDNLQLDVIKVVWMVLPTMDDFGVKNTGDWYRLCTELDNSAFLVLAGAGDGKYTKFLGESVSRTETVNVSPQSQGNNRQGQKPGLLDGIRNKLLGR